MHKYVPLCTMMYHYVTLRYIDTDRPFDLLTQLLTYHIYLSAYLPIYLSTYLPICLLPIYLHRYIATILHPYLHGYIARQLHNYIAKLQSNLKWNTTFFFFEAMFCFFYKLGYNLIIRFSIWYHGLSSIYHPFIIHLSSIYHPFIIHLSSIYHSFIIHFPYFS